MIPMELFEMIYKRRSVRAYIGAADSEKVMAI